jgi:hypothetical protein
MNNTKNRVKFNKKNCNKLENLKKIDIFEQIIGIKKISPKKRGSVEKEYF